MDSALFKQEFGDEAATAVSNYYHYKGNGANFGDQDAINKMNEAANILKSKGINIKDLNSGKQNARIEDL